MEPFLNIRSITFTFRCSISSLPNDVTYRPNIFRLIGGRYWANWPIPRHSVTHIKRLEACGRETGIQYNTIQYNTIQYDTVQYNTMQYNAIQCNTMQCNAIQYNALQCNAIQYNTVHKFLRRHNPHETPAQWLINNEAPYSTAAKGYDCAFCDKSTKIGTLVVLYI